MPNPLRTEAERIVLQQEGLIDWTVKDAADGYCWYNTKTIQRIPGDHALFLHEVAHALCADVKDDPLWNQDATGHHSLWADRFTELVRKELLRVQQAQREVLNKVALHHADIFLGCKECQRVVNAIRRDGEGEQRPSWCYQEASKGFQAWWSMRGTETILPKSERDSLQQFLANALLRAERRGRVVGLRESAEDMTHCRSGCAQSHQETFRHRATALETDA